MNRLFIWTAIKKTVKKRTFIVPLGLIVLLTLFVYVANNNNEKKGFIINDLNSCIKNAELMKRNAKSVDDFGPKDQIRLDEMKVAAAAYNNENWSKFALNYNKVTVGDDGFNSDTVQFDAADKEDISAAIQINTLKYVAKHNCYPNGIGTAMSVQGLPFVFDFLTLIFPILIFPILLFMLAPIFSDKFKGKMNLDVLFPQKLIFFERNRFVAAISLLMMVYMLIIVIGIIMGTVFRGLGGPGFPLYYALEGKIEHTAVGNALLQTFILQFISLTAVVALLQLITNITKNQILGVLLTALITIPQIIAPLVFHVINQFMQLLPGAYIAAPNIVNKNWVNMTHNHNLTLANGLIVSVSYLVLIRLVNYGYNQNVVKNTVVKFGRRVHE